MIRVTENAMSHWTGRCRQKLPEGVHGIRAKSLVRVVMNGRIATKEEARVVSLFVSRARWQNSVAAKALGPDNVIVSEAHGVAFVLRFETDRVIVISAVPMSLAKRRVAGLNPRRLRKRQRRESCTW